MLTEDDMYCTITDDFLYEPVTFHDDEIHIISKACADRILLESKKTEERNLLLKSLNLDTKDETPRCPFCREPVKSYKPATERQIAVAEMLKSGYQPREYSEQDVQQEKLNHLKMFFKFQSLQTDESIEQTLYFLHSTFNKEANFLILSSEDGEEKMKEAEHPLKLIIRLIPEYLLSGANHEILLNQIKIDAHENKTVFIETLYSYFYQKIDEAYALCGGPPTDDIYEKYDLLVKQGIISAEADYIERLSDEYVKYEEIVSDHYKSYAKSGLASISPEVQSPLAMLAATLQFFGERGQLNRTRNGELLTKIIDEQDQPIMRSVHPGNLG